MTSTIDATTVPTRGSLLLAGRARLSRVASSLSERQPHLTRFGTAMVAASLVTPLLMVIDDREVLGVNVWVKPTKFFASIGIYALTLAWGFAFLTPRRREGRAARYVIAVTIGAGALEQAIITTRAALGQRSHFNTGTPADAAWYSLMGLGAVLLVSTAGVLGVMVWRSGVLTGARRLGWAAGLLIAGVLGGATGGIMSAGEGHWVGNSTTDRGGIPFLGWSTTVGDLRIAHFLGLHAMFVLPLAGWLAHRRWGDRPVATRATWGVAALWVGVIVAAFANAMAGNPL